MVWDDNHYYVIGHSEKHPEPFIINFRIDRICHAEITEEPSILPEDGFSLEEYVNRQFRMNVGECIEVGLECRNERMRDVIDHFGEDVETWVSDEEHFRVRARVANSPTFYSWVFGFVGDIRIIEPEAAVKRYKQMLRSGLK
jgi:predicted DNA-binding transcriptional regulator YafY